MIYLDNAATTEPCAESVKACSEYFREFGNPSSLHEMGVSAANAVAAARKSIATALKADVNEIYFTSCATESNNTAIFGAAKKFGKRKKTIVTSAVEHSSVNEPLKELEKQGFNVVRIMPKDGVFYAEDFVNAVDDDTFLVTCMYCNNEIGTVLPVEQIFKAVKRKNKQILTHCDIVQGFMKYPIKVKTLGADMLSMSAHKVNAFKGIGALYINSSVHIPSLIFGGGQERGFRSGTESVPLIASFGAAVDKLAPTISSRFEQVGILADLLRTEIAALPDSRINSPENGSPYIVSFSLKGYRSEILLHKLEEREIYVSSGSACSKGKKSSVLTAFGIPDEYADSTLRVSLSAENTREDILALVSALKDAQKELLKSN